MAAAPVMLRSRVGDVPPGGRCRLPRRDLRGYAVALWTRVGLDGQGHVHLRRGAAHLWVSPRLPVLRPLFEDPRFAGAS